MSTRTFDIHALRRLTGFAVALAIVAYAMLASAQQTAPVAEPQGTGTGPIYVIPVDGVIEMGIAPFIERSLREAEAANAVAVILTINTPGGRVDAAERIADALVNSSVPTYAYVNPRAFSAGALIALAATEIYMRPGAVIGAATPVSGEGEKAPEKIVSALRSEFRALAERRGLDPRVAEAMVDEEIAIEGIVEQGKLLSLSTTEAVRIGYAQEVESLEALKAQVGAEGAAVVVTETNWAERLVRFLTNPIVAPFLLSLGFLGLLIEIKTPSVGVAGLAGATSLGLFFGSHLILGLAGWEVVILLVAGIILLLVEALIIPGFGVAGVLGTLAILGSIFLSIAGTMPTSQDVMLAVQVIAASLLIFGFATWQLIQRLPSERRSGRILLNTAVGRDEGYISATARQELIGTDGVAVTDLRPAGTARFGEELIDVVSEGGWIIAGTKIRVVRADAYRQVVRPVENGSGTVQEAVG
jgi:membrane-bound serine protease (ClpP class)